MVNNKVGKNQKQSNQKQLYQKQNQLIQKLVNLNKEKINDGIYYKRLWDKSQKVNVAWMWTLLCVQFLTLPFIFLFPSINLFLGINWGCLIGVMLNALFYFWGFRPFWIREMKRRFKI